jgi:all-trans-retinol dehydrogenase (NAD+)
LQLNNKIALITGAARGIGQATAKELARAGADIFGVDLHVDDLQETTAHVTKLGRKFSSLACDISDERAVRDLINSLSQRGGFDVLVNNAGVLPSGAFLEREFDVWRKAIDVNLLGLMAFTHAVLPILLKRQQAHIVNIASIAGKFGTEGVAAYAASKHGVVGFSSALRFELEGTAVGVSWICPSMVNTRMAAGVPQHLLTPRVEPEDVARAIRRAIETNAAEVFVPGRVRFWVSILPAVLPGVARFISSWSGASRGWLTRRA